MTGLFEGLVEGYVAALRRYLRGDDDDEALLAAYELGRQALQGGSGVVELAGAYEAALNALLAGDEREFHPWVALRALALLRESLGAAEMALQGYVAANTALSENRARLRAVLDNAPAAIAMKAPDGRYVLVNRRFEEHFGVQGRSLLEGGYGPELPPEAAERWQALEGRALAEDQPVLSEEETSCAGDVRVLLAVRFPVRDPTGRLLGTGYVSQDITERKRAEESLRLAREEAERANWAKSEFLSRMSHELRTPLNAVLGFAQLLEIDQPRPDQFDSIAHILKAGRHLLTLIDEVLDISRIEAGRLALSLEPVPVDEVTRDAMDLMRPAALERQATLWVEADVPADVYVVADRQRIKQILLNLVSNAIKYNRPGGKVRLWWESNEEQVKIHVQDTGIGISSDLMARLFQPFERLGAPSTIEGTGLGLALSHHLAHAMGGRLDADSREGEGSTFALQLPRAPAPTGSDEHHRGRAHPPLVGTAERSATLLYVEDNLVNIQLIQHILARRPGIELLTTLQGSLALELAAQHEPDVVLLNLHLPDMPGEEVLQRLQAEPRTKNARVVIVSADATPGQIERLLALGAADYLTKPFDVPHFLAVIDTLLLRPDRPPTSRRAPPAAPT